MAAVGGPSTAPAEPSGRLVVTVPAAVAVVLAVVYYTHAPLVSDLAAQTARANLFTRSGNVPWWGSWYGGLVTSSYSLVTPALLSSFGPVLLGSACLVITPLAALPILRLARRPVAGGVALAGTAAADVTSGRTTFALGLVVALLSLSLASRARPRWAAGAAALAAVTSPVAGVLGLLVSGTVAAAQPQRRAWLASAAGSLGGIAVLWWLSGGVSAGVQPMGTANLLLTMGGALIVLVAPVGRVVRSVAAVSMVATVFVLLVPSPVGSNLNRIVLIGMVPAIVANARLRPSVLMTVGLISIALPSFNLAGDLLQASRPGSSEQFVAGLRSQLATEPLLKDHRLELVDVATHWPSTRLVSTVTLARGWERQADEALNPELYPGPTLTSAGYRSFLDRNAVAFVALPRNAPLDIGTQSEATLIAGGLPYLTLEWSDKVWRLYAVSRPTPIVATPATEVRLTDTGVTFYAPRVGQYRTDLRWSPYLVAGDATVTRDGRGDAVVTASRAGVQTVHAVWRLP